MVSAKKPTANIIFNDKSLKAFLLRLAMTQGCLLSPYLFVMYWHVLASAINQKRELKYVRIVKEELELFFFADYMIIHIIENLKNLHINSYKSVYQGCWISNQC